MMFKILAVAAVCSVFVGLVYSHDPRIGGVDWVPIKSEDGRCVAEDSSRHDEGVHWYYPGECSQFVCVKKGDEFFVEVSHCKDISMHPDRERTDCEYTVRYGVFPRCCPTYVCRPTTTEASTTEDNIIGIEGELEEE